MDNLSLELIQLLSNNGKSNTQFNSHRSFQLYCILILTFDQLRQLKCPEEKYQVTLLGMQGIRSGCTIMLMFAMYIKCFLSDRMQQRTYVKVQNDGRRRRRRRKKQQKRKFVFLFFRLLFFSSYLLSCQGCIITTNLGYPLFHTTYTIWRTIKSSLNSNIVFVKPFQPFDSLFTIPQTESIPFFFFVLYQALGAISSNIVTLEI